MDLSLVPIDDLIKEVESRCSAMILAYQKPEDKKVMLYFQYGKGTWYQSCLLSNILNNDVLNNWNGELKTLQRIHEDSL